MNKIKKLMNNGCKELKKHISIIHCSNNLSLLQRKISNILLFHAYPLLKTQEEYQIAISELCKYLEYRGYNYEAIKQALKALISTVIEWNVFGDNTQDEDWTASSILASVNIKKAVCTYSYSPRMKELLYSPAMYGRIDLAIQSRFTSNYGLALYENCSRYRKLAKTKLLSLEQFRKIMGVANDKYLIFRDFKKRVIDKAVEEVNALSDLIVETHINKIGDKVASICFSIVEKKNNSNFLSHNKKIISNNHEKEKNIQSDFWPQNNGILINKLKKIYFLSDQTINELVNKYGIDKLESKTKQIESTKAFINGKVSNVAGFLVDALKKDYMPHRDSSTIIEEKRISREREAYEIRQLSLEQDKIKKEYDNYVDKQICNFINEIDQEKLQGLLAQFTSYLQNKNSNTILHKFKRFGLNNKIVRIFFKNFLKETTCENILEYISFEQFSNEIK